MKHRTAWALVALVFAFGSVASAAGPGYALAALPADTVLRVRLNDSLRSDMSHPGDRFTATVEDPSLPSGTLVRGVITDVVPADKQTPGRIGVDFLTLELPNGRRISMEGTPIGLDSKSVRTTASGSLVARSHRNGNTGKYVGYGAAGGLVIGSLVGKNVVGGLLGAGAGFLFGRHKKAEHRDVALKEGTEMGVRLDQQVALTGA